MSRHHNARAAMATAGASEFAVTDVEIDGPAPGEVLVRVEAVGMCHTDLAARDGDFPFPLPGILGHEGAGTVERVGRGVTQVAKGDRVILSFHFCGSCRQCLNGRPSRCLQFLEHNFTAGGRMDGSPSIWRQGEPLHGGFFGQSSFSTLALAYETSVVRVDSDLPAEVLAPLGCGVQTGAGAMLNVLKPGPGSHVLVFGGGAVGLSAAFAAMSMGANTIVADVNPDRLESATRAGVQHALNPADESFAEDLLSLTHGYGPDVLLEASGSVPAFETAVAVAAVGARIGVVGVPTFETRSPLHIAELVNGSKTVIGIVEGDSNPRVFLPQLVEFVESGEIPVDKMITVYPFDEINAAAHDLHRGASVKPVLTL